MTTVQEVADRARDVAEDAADSRWAEVLGRAGLASRGVVYVVVALIAVSIATGHQGQADKQGALETVARQPLGRLLLLILAVGFAGYAVWRVVKAASGAREGGGSRRGASGAVKRLGDVGRALLYLSLLLSTLALLMQTRGHAHHGSNEQSQSWTNRVMQHTGGRWAVGAVGIGLVVGGLLMAWRGLAQKFEKKLKMRQMRGWQRRWLPPLGSAGYTARGIVLGLVGVFVLRAAINFDPHEAVGVDGALKRLAQQRYGPVLLLAVAAGLAAFGLYSFVEARYRKVLDD